MLPVHHPVSKTPLPLFFLDLKNNPKNESIFSIDKLYYAKIKVEPPKPRRSVIQCLNCQGYGHTKNYCRLPARCVRCEEAHSSDRCPNPKGSPPKCANCGGSHTANYRGCPTHKQLQHRRPERHFPNCNPKPHSPDQTSAPDSNPASYPTLQGASNPRAERTRPVDRLSMPHNQNGHAHYSYSSAVKQSTINPKQSSIDILAEKVDQMLALLQPLVQTLSQILPVLISKI